MALASIESESHLVSDVHTGVNSFWGGEQVHVDL